MIKKIKARSIKFFVLFLFGILMFQTTYSQVNFIPGKIISLKGDTLTGLVDYRNWRRNPNKIDFKQIITNEPITYSPTNILGFIVKDEIYESGIVDSNIDLLKDGRLIEDITVHSKVDTTFLQAFKIGAKSLYFYRNKDAIESFYIKKDVSNLIISVYQISNIKG